MKGFCQHCGKELNGDEPFCPECGSPTGPVPQPTYYAPPKKRTNMWIVVIACIAALCIIGIAFLPSLIQESGDYKVTMTVDELSVDLADLTQYEGAGTHTNVILKLRFDNGTSSVEKNITLYKDYVLNSGAKAPNFENGVTFNVKGSPNDISYSAFLCIERTYSDGYRTWTTADTVDLYTVDTTKIVGGSSYFGCSGVVFTADDYSGSGSMDLKGDSDPIGYVKLTFKSVKL